MNTGERIKVSIHGKEREAIVLQINDNMDPEIIALDRPITYPKKSWPIITYAPELQYLCGVLRVSIVDHIGWNWDSFTRLVAKSDELETLPTIPVAKQARKYPEDCPCQINSFQCNYHNY